METNELANILEAVLFASGEAVEMKRLCQALDTDITSLEEAAARLDEKYAEGSGIELLRLDSALQLATKEDYAAQIKAVLEIKRSSALSPAAMEALTIVAYNQPVTKAFVESVRGVDSSGVVNSLVEKGLLAEAGRLDLPGRPIAYKTTENFLRAFRLSSIKDLPPLPEQSGQVTIDDILEEQADDEPEN
ncbi:SMC-Scp complex subunit ScpB [Ruminococcus sp.]|uniref:SMC-Scp complex subunit ScpB n=1 Tax=Ruminococcus sp. TaxID=41978 RepID=UPI0025CCF81D|nr:SMC-Scp complex subunit ScpB [Ruminococcus sp.]MBQ8965675.1 SMC-Scp complex subunit ScpB [Ruminococcus sp.]